MIRIYSLAALAFWRNRRLNGFQLQFRRQADDAGYPAVHLRRPPFTAQDDADRPGLVNAQLVDLRLDGIDRYVRNVVHYRFVF